MYERIFSNSLSNVILLLIIACTTLQTAMPIYWPSFADPYRYDPHLGVCGVNIYNAKYIIPIFAFYTFGPVPITIYSYMGIFRKVFLSKMAIRGRFSPADLKLYKCLLIIFSFYMLSKAPEIILVLDSLHWINWPVMWSRLGITLFPINAVANAFITGWLNPDFSPFFKRVVLWKC